MDLDFTTVTDAQLKQLLKDVGTPAPRPFTREAAILRLQMRFLMDPNHFDAVVPGAVGSDLIAVFARLNTLPGAIYSNIGKLTNYMQVNGRYPSTNVYSSQLYDMMANPTAFDDSLLALVPPGTYSANEVWAGIFAEEVFPVEYAFDIRTLPGVMTAYFAARRAVQTYHRTIKEGGSFENATDTKGSPFLDPMWVEDVGLSGTSYVRLMFTMPSRDGTAEGGDIWSTPPFGLAETEPVPMLINRVTIPEFGALVQGLNILKHTDRLASSHPGLPGFFKSQGAVFVPNSGTSLSEIANLRELIDQIGIPELCLRARTADLMSFM